MEHLLGIDLVTLVKAAGYLGLFGIVFAESGLLIGFFFPGDSLLFTAGVLASQGYLNIVPLALLTFAAAILGDNFGYAFGRRVGVKIFTREDSVIFHKDHLRRAEAYYEKFGPSTIILARFMPVIRTFAPIVAGVGRMNYRQFLTFNLIGGFVWGLGMPILGYISGSAVPNIDKYMLPIVLFIIFASIAPPAWHFFKEKHHRGQVVDIIKRLFNSILGRK